MVDFEKKLFQFILSYIFDHVIKKYFLYSFVFLLCFMIWWENYDFIN